MKIPLLYLPILIPFLFSCQPGNETEKHLNQQLTYPVTVKVDSTNTYFGTTISDPYQWLEDDLSADTKAWVNAQNEVTFSYLDELPFREAIENRLRGIYNFERFGAPSKHGDYLYYTKNNGLQNQSVWYRKKGEDGPEEMFLDPNQFKEDGTISLAGSFFSKDGSLFGYLISEGGADWRKAIIWDAETKTQIGDTLTNIKFSGLAWKGNEGFYYSSCSYHY